MPTYTYRRELTSRELMPAIGAGVAAGVGVGLVVGYLTQLMLRKDAFSSRPPSRRDAPEPRA